MATADELEEEAAEKESGAEDEARRLREAAEARRHEEQYQRDLDEAKQAADRADERAHTSAG